MRRWLAESQFQRASMTQSAIKSRIYSGNSEFVPIEAFIGQPCYFNVLARNDQDFTQTYKV